MEEVEQRESCYPSFPLGKGNPFLTLCLGRAVTSIKMHQLMGFKRWFGVFVLGSKKLIEMR